MVVGGPRSVAQEAVHAIGVLGVVEEANLREGTKEFDGLFFPGNVTGTVQPGGRVKPEAACLAVQEGQIEREHEVEQRGIFEVEGGASIAGRYLRQQRHPAAAMAEAGRQASGRGMGAEQARREE